MRNIHVGIFLQDEQGQIISKRIISGNWSVDLEYQLKTHFEVDVSDEIASVLKKNVVAQLQSSTIKDMIEEAKEEMNDESTDLSCGTDIPKI